MDVSRGDLGQFDVMLDGEVIATRSKSFLLRLAGGGWPDEQEVIATLRARLQPTAGGGATPAVHGA